MNKFLSSILSSIGLTSKVSKDNTVLNIVPQQILCTIPTISSDEIQLIPFEKELNDTCVIFHEDDWAQIEFYSKNQIDIIKNKLKDYKEFEKKHKLDMGWSNLYIRTMQRLPIFTTNNQIQSIETALNVKVGSAPILVTMSEILGQVKNGFSFDVNEDVILYGYADGNEILFLGALVKNNNYNELAKAFYKLNSNDDIVLVDWIQQVIFLDLNRNDNSIKLWQP